MRRPLRFALLWIVLASSAVPAAAQTFEAAGTRAAGMGGAFVAVADDASAVYWNPAGLIMGGSYLGLVIDGSFAKSEPDNTPNAGRGNAQLIALSTPPLGLSYYRLESTKLRPLPTFGPAPVTRVTQLTTHHAGVTLVQSLTQSVAVAATLKLVRGTVESGIVLGASRDDLLDSGPDLPDNSTNTFDADIGVMATLGKLRAGLTVRNVTSPDFDATDGTELTLDRQTRAGVSYRGLQGVILAADFDLERVQGTLGDVQNFALGAEAQVVRRVALRTGVRLNMLSDEPGGSATAFSLGGTVATFRSLLVDAQVTMGAEAADRGWGVAARLVY